MGKRESARFTGLDPVMIKTSGSGRRETGNKTKTQARGDIISDSDELGISGSSPCQRNR